MPSTDVGTPLPGCVLLAAGAIVEAFDTAGSRI